jgi:hypothetical protein
VSVRSFATFVTFLAIGARAIQAQDTRAPQRPLVPIFGFSVGSVSIDPARAATAQVADRAWGLQLDASVLMKRYITLGFDLGTQFLDDQAQFSQNTTGGTMKSTASVTYLSAATGLRTGALGPFSLGATVGASVSFGKRSIDNCSNCQVDNLTIPGGPFAEPALLVAVRKFQVRVTDRLYTRGDGMRNVMSVGAQISPKKK